MRGTLKEVLMSRDGLSDQEAEGLIAEAKTDLHQRIDQGDPSAHDICEEYFGLEPDYLDELLF